MNAYSEAFRACLRWPRTGHPEPPAGPARPLISARVPVLVIGGDLDSWTPASDDPAVLRQIGPSARLVVLRNAVHTSTEGDILLTAATRCGRHLVRAFVAAPQRLRSLNAACAGRIPPIHTPGSFPLRLSGAAPPASSRAARRSRSGALRRLPPRRSEMRPRRGGRPPATAAAGSTAAASPAFSTEPRAPAPAPRAVCLRRGRVGLGDVEHRVRERACDCHRLRTGRGSVPVHRPVFRRDPACDRPRCGNGADAARPVAARKPSGGEELRPRRVEALREEARRAGLETSRGAGASGTTDRAGYGHARRHPARAHAAGAACYYARGRRATHHTTRPRACKAPTAAPSPRAVPGLRGMFSQLRFAHWEWVALALSTPGSSRLVFTDGPRAAAARATNKGHACLCGDARGRPWRGLVAGFTPTY